MWVVCHRAPVANCRRGVLQSCMSEKTEDPFEPFWPAFLLKHPEGASEEALSRTAGPIRSHSHLNVCSLDDQRNMQICTPCPGILTKWLTRISKPMEKAGEEEQGKRRREKNQKRKNLSAEVASCWDSHSRPRPNKGCFNILGIVEVHPRSRPKVFVCRLFSLPYSMHLPYLPVTNLSPLPSRL